MESPPTTRHHRLMWPSAVISSSSPVAPPPLQTWQESADPIVDRGKSSSTATPVGTTRPSSSPQSLPRELGIPPRHDLSPRPSPPLTVPTGVPVIRRVRAEGCLGRSQTAEPNERSRGQTARGGVSGVGSGGSLPKTEPATRLFATPDAEVVEFIWMLLSKGRPAKVVARSYHAFPRLVKSLSTGLSTGLAPGRRNPAPSLWISGARRGPSSSRCVREWAVDLAASQPVESRHSPDDSGEMTGPAPGWQTVCAIPCTVRLVIESRPRPA